MDLKGKKEEYEQFEVDSKEEVKKPKNKMFKKIRNIILFVIIIAAIYFIYKRTSEINDLKKTIEDEKKRREEEKNILLDSKVIAGSIE